MITLRKVINTITVFAAFCLCLSVLPAEAASVQYAKPGGLSSGTCDSWDNGCELRFALANAVSGQEIWVKAGTYKPTAGADRTATFQLVSGVALYGGFATELETLRNQRDFSTNITILSGDLLGDDGASFTNRADNSYHVVTGANSATLDGFTVTGGNADGSVYSFTSGGGMLNDSASPTVTNCTFSGNFGVFGGGMFNGGASPTVTNCTFSGNRSNFGAGIANGGASPTVTNCTFSGNNAVNYGGAMYNSGGGIQTITNSTFSGNSGSYGGAMHNEDVDVTMTNCTFSGNTTSGTADAAAIENYRGVQTIRNSILWGDDGGEIFNNSNTLLVTNSVVQGGYAGTGNSAADPLLVSLGSYGGATQTIPLLPGSSAIDVGDAATCATTDQRGKTRIGACDIGAFESQGFTLTKTGGDSQSAARGATFANPLEVSVTTNNAVEPVDGGVVTFAAPGSGASLATTGFTLTVTGGAVVQSVTANGVGGSYGVTAEAAGATGVSFALTNIAVPAVSVAATAGTPGPTIYVTLEDAFDAINAGTHQGAITITVFADTFETASAVVSASGSGAASYTGIVVQPAGGRIVYGNLAAPLIDLNGATNVTIDGLNTGGDALALVNTNADSAAETSTIRFINGAANNKVRNATILGSSTTAVSSAGGTVLFSTSTGGGNSLNVIELCNIGPAGTNLPTKAVMGLGSAGGVNTGNVIVNNNIYDFFSPTASVSGISVQGNNTAWAIAVNRIYQSAPRTFTGAGLRYAGMTFDSNGSFSVTGNRIGFGAADGTGTTTISGSTNEVRGIDIISVSTTTTSTIQGNTISGIVQTSAQNSTTWTSPCFTGIIIGNGTTDGRVDILQNTIGSLDGSSTIVLNETSTTLGTMPATMIFDDSLSSNTIVGNSIGNITITAGGSGTKVGFLGILAQTMPSATETITDNVIANITDTIVGAYSMYGIRSDPSAASITGNTVRNMTGNSNSASVVMEGIYAKSSNTTGASTIARNSVHSLSNASGAALTAIYAIDVSMTTAAGVTGNLVEQNSVHSLALTSTNPSSQLLGIIMRGQGSATFRNNMIRLGLDASGSTITGGLYIAGIRDVAGATSSYYYNSVYIGGAGVASSSNTYAFYSTGTNTRNFVDNIFWNARSNASGTGKNYAISVAGTTANPAGLTSNYNDLYATGTGGYVGIFSSVARASLADWRTATGQDATSISVDPQFLVPDGTASTGDLHIRNTGPAAGAATPVSGTTNDFDGDTRSTVVPSIGADEVKPATTTTLASAANPAAFSDSVTFTATVTPTPTGGSVAFKDNGTTITGCAAQPLTGGQATCATAALTPGLHSITADYSGDTNYSGSTSATLVQTVNLAPAITSATSASITFGTAASFTVTTTGFPTPALTRSGILPMGVSFKDNGNGTATISGTANASGSFPFTLTATNSAGTAPQSFTLTVSATALGDLSAVDTNIAVSPDRHLFGVETIGDCLSSTPTTFTVRNIGASPLTLGTLAIGGDDAGQFAIGSDTCSGNSLATTASCAAEVKFCPTSVGSKTATLLIPSDAPKTPIISAFLHNHESTREEASRRMPPVLERLNIPTIMESGEQYTITWSLLGYEEDYLSLAAFFNCAGIPAGSCGDSFAGNFASSGNLAPVSSVTGDWTYNGITSKRFDYSYTFTAPTVAVDTNIVIRFYRKSLGDNAAGKGSLSLLIPGNVLQTGTSYYDLTGRRLLHVIEP